MEKIEAPDIGKLLQAYVKKNRIRQSGWARTAGIHPKTVAKYLKQPTMQIATLFAICQTLKYNFLKDIADHLPPDMPPVTDNPLQSHIAQLEQQVHDLELHVKVLREALELVGRK